MGSGSEGSAAQEASAEPRAGERGVENTIQFVLSTFGLSRYRLWQLELDRSYRDDPILGQEQSEIDWVGKSDIGLAEKLLRCANGSSNASSPNRRAETSAVATHLNRDSGSCTSLFPSPLGLRFSSIDSTK